MFFLFYIHQVMLIFYTFFALSIFSIYAEGNFFKKITERIKVVNCSFYATVNFFLRTLIIFCVVGDGANSI
jgi:hypothetical protein